MVYPSIAEIPEPELVAYFMQNPLWRSTLLEIEGINSEVIPLINVLMAGLPGKPRGDIDILAARPDRPELATTVSVKRIKINPRQLRQGKPGKLKELELGVRQVNLLADIGFAQVYAYVFVVVDSREQNAGRITYDGLPMTLRSFLAQQITTTGLTPRIGLIHWEMVQPMDQEPFLVGTYGGHLIRRATVVEQPPEVTAWVAEQYRAAAAASAKSSSELM